MATLLCSEAPQIFRPLANFPPSLWGNLFTSFSVDIKARELYAKEHEGLKEKVRTMFDDAPTYKISEKINLINTVERLGVSYHFEKEIEALLYQMFDIHTKFQDDVQQFDFFTMGNYFRILRQHGYTISCDIFDKLKGDNDEFKDELKDDVIGMLSLYEASYLRTHGESILDEALIFTKARLGSMIGTTSLSQFVENQVTYALNQPLHKGVPRIESRNYISFYEEDPNKNDVLLRFSKIDFNLLQMIHRQEMCDISRWWNDLEFESKLSYARNRVAEAYLWCLSVYYEPKYSFARIMLAKVMLMLSVTDDTYDAYGTFDELKVFTDAIQRWDISAIDELPDYMKSIYRALLDVYEEIQDQLSKQENNCSYGIAYSREMYIEMVKSYETENIWFTKRYVPSFEEYMKNALVTAANRVLVITSFLGMGKDATAIQAFEWVKSNPKMITASNTIVRLIDDIMSHEEEDERGHVATGIECYVKEHGLTEEEVIAEFNKMNENAWKDINAEFIKPNNLPLDVLMRALNLTRVAEVVYKYDDGYTHPEKTFKNYIILLFVDTITI